MDEAGSVTGGRRGVGLTLAKLSARGFSLAIVEPENLDVVEGGCRRDKLARQSGRVRRAREVPRAETALASADVLAVNRKAGAGADAGPPDKGNDGSNGAGLNALLDDGKEADRDSPNGLLKAVLPLLDV